MVMATSTLSIGANGPRAWLATVSGWTVLSRWVFLRGQISNHWPLLSLPSRIGGLHLTHMISIFCSLVEHLSPLYARGCTTG